MNKNVKRIFLGITLLTLLLAVTTVSATDNDTTDVVSQAPTVVEDASTDVVSTEQVQTSSDDNPVNTENKIIEKEDKNVKKDSITIDGVEYTNIIENQEIDEPELIFEENTFLNNCIINGEVIGFISCNGYLNSSTVNALLFNHGETSVNNSYLNVGLSNDPESTLYIYNSSLDGIYFENHADIYIDEESIINNLEIEEQGNVYSNNPYFKGDKVIENSTIIEEVTYVGNVQLINCNISAKITTEGNITLVNCSLSNNNMTTTWSKTDGFLLENKGNTTLIGCTVGNNTFNTTTNPDYLWNYPITGAIANKGNLYVFNSTFQNNTVGYKIHVNDGSYFGVDYICGGAGCIYNNGGNLTIDNSLFKDNYAGNDFGAILSTNNYTNVNYQPVLVSEANIYIKNSTFINNSANNTGVGLRISGRQTLFEGRIITDDYIVMNSDLTLIDNCTFYNNRGSRLSLSAGNLNMTSSSLSCVSVGAINVSATNNTLNNSWISASGSADIVDNLFANQSGLSTSSTEYVISIHDNNFTDNNYTSNTVKLPVDKSNTMIFNNTYYNTGLNDSLDWVIPLKSYVNDTINVTYSIGNPEFYDDDLMDNFTFDVYVDDELYTTTSTLDGITLNKSGDIVVSVKPLKSSQTFRQNIEVFKLQDVVITPENYDTYIVDGTLTRVKEDDRVLFQGNFTDKGTIYVDTDDVVIDGYDAHFTNTCFVIDSQNTIIQHLNIDNTDTTYPINNTGKNNYIINNNINITNVDGLTAAIKNTASKVTIKDNILYVDGPAKTIDYTENGISNTQAILVVGTNKNTIQNNTITVTTTTEGEVYGTIEAITTNGVTDTHITQNTIYASNAKFTYGINMLAGVSDNSITANNITVTSYRYCDGIQVGNQAENILIQDNNINIYCHNTTPVDEEAISYGIITTNMGAGTSDYINIYYNNITIDSTVGYGIEIYQTTNTEIRFNNINVTGAYSMGIGYAHSPNSHVVANNIYCQADSTTTLASVTEEIQPETVGIKIQQDSTNIKIDDGWVYGGSIPGANTIHTNDKAGTDYAINVESTGTTISGNKLRSTNKTGSDAIKNNTQYSSSNGNDADNIYTNIEIQTPETILVNQTTTLTITIKDEYDNPLDTTITITIDDQTTNLTTTNGQATYTYTPINTGTQSITATFQGIYNYNATTTTKTLTVSTITLTVDPITANIGDTINITARITLGNQTYTDINSGKISFKVNGKTLKDANGKVIYAKVTDGVATIENYIVPNDWSKENTTIQAVYSGSKQCDKLTSEKTPITVTPSTPTITTTDITASAGETITLTATITNGDNIINNGKVVFKINGKTVKDTNGKVIYAKVSNNQVNFTYTLPEDMKVKDYNLTAVFISSDYDRLEDTKVLTVN